MIAVAVIFSVSCLVVVTAMLMYLKKLVKWHRWKWRPRWWRRRHGRISILVPFRSDSGVRDKTWDWLYRYWRRVLPEAEFIIGQNHDTPFCKTAAVNDAFRKAKGDVIVIMDADCYIDACVIKRCAQEIREARKAGRRLWFIPYRRFYRMTREVSEWLLETDPCDPPRFRDPPPPWEVEHIWRNSSGHWWGALIQIMPREAFEAAGGMDERFKGWGSEDISFMHAVDTLYAKHKTVNSPVYHLWHPSIKGKWLFTRQWPDQPGPEMNDQLAWRYENAVGDKLRMHKLLSERDGPLS